MNKKILITGITGFVGSHMADYLIAKDQNIELYGLKRWHLSRMENLYHIIEKINLFDCDITDPVSTLKTIKEINPDIIFHCAAESFVSPSWDHPNRYMSVNYQGTVNLLEALKNINSKAIIHLPGSGEEYGKIYENEIPITDLTALRPVNPYAVTKIAQDLIGYVYHESYGLKVIRTRAFNHEGPRRQNVFGIASYAYQIAKIEKGYQAPLIKVGKIDDRRNFTHVIDMVEAYYLSIEYCKPGELYLIGNEDPGSVFTFKEALERLISMSSVKNIKYEEHKPFVRPTDVPRLIADVSKFQKLTGWKPKKTFEDILLDTLEYWRNAVTRNPKL